MNTSRKAPISLRFPLRGIQLLIALLLSFFIFSKAEAQITLANSLSDSDNDGSLIIKRTSNSDASTTPFFYSGMDDSAPKVDENIYISSFTPYTVPVPVTVIDFTGEGWSNSQNLGASLTRSDFVFSHYNSSLVPTAIYASIFGEGFPFTNPDWSLRIDKAYLVIKKTDGSEFDFQSLYAIGVDDQTVSISGYRNTKSVATTSAATSISGARISPSTLDGGFANVDSVVVSNPNGILDTFNFAPPTDLAPPDVKKILVASSPSGSATSINYTVSFYESANNLSIDDFQLTKTGTAQGTISAISAVSGTSVNVTVNAISGDGTLRLDLKSNTNITDDLGNGNNNNGYVQAYTGGVSHTVDFTAPTGYTVSFDQTSVNAVNKSNISFTFSGAEVGGTYSYDFSSSSGGSASTTGRSVLSSSKTVGLSEMEILGDGTVTLNFTHKDAAGNTGNTVTKTIIKDTVLPVFENSTPSSSNIGEKIFDLNLDMNEAGKLYYVIVPDGATAPTAADVKAGNANGGGTPVTGGNASVTTGGFSNTFNVAGLSIVTAYDVYAIAEDVAGNLVNTVSKIDVATVDLNDPVFTSPTTANFAENGTGTAYTAVATDANTITYSLGNAKDEALFNIVGATGVVTFKNAPDFENPTDGNTDNAYVINVIANDGTHSVNQDVTITVTDIDEINPVFTSATTANFAENGTGTAYTVVATDVNTVTYSLGNAKDEALFNIVGTTGVVTFKNAPDYENPADGNTDNAYVINVIASDGRNSVNQNVTITVTDIDEINPVFTSATTANFAENGIGAAYTVVATDANALTYSLSGCFDDALFNIANGVVTFKNTPDFETPVDVDANNTYVINVVASDGVNSVNQDVTITVTNVNEDPSITSNAVTAGNDNATYTYNITTSDIDNDAVTVTATVKPDWLSLSSSATVSTFAGSGTSGYADGTGTAASFGQPFGMVVDNTGNLYVSSYSHRIRKITPAGVVSIFAGSGDYGSANGTGTAASFANPSGMAMDAAGNLFVADFGNHTIRKITPAGVVTTFAGMNGVRGSADATGTNASFSGPIGMAIDGSDNLYVTELVNNRIRKITPTGVVTTFAGSGSGTPVDGTGLVAAFGGPDAIEIDESGNLYVTEQNSHLVRKITPAGVVTTIAGTGSTGSADGTGTSASFNTPYDVLVDGSNNLLIADAFNHTIRKITPAGEVTTIAGLALNTGSENGAGTDARFNSPIGLAMNSDGEVFVAELGNHLIRKIVFGDQLSGDATGQSGNHNVTLTASDGNGATATQSFVVDVSRVLTPDDDNILYVNKDVRGGNGRGGSWANAVTELADALVWAKENYDNTWATTPLQIWVAGGTYKPLYTPEDGEDFAVGTDPRDNAFLLVNNVELYGGFAGTETALTDRDLSLTANATILSGDFNDDDVVTGTGSSISFSGNTENAYHVIISAGSVGKARVDGFTVTNANANGSNSITVNSISFIRNYGGGMFIDASSPTIQQSTFVHNYSSDYGSGIFNDHSSAPKVSNSIFKDNKVGSCGAAMYNYNSSSPTITNSLFIGNSADDYGGAIYNSASSSSIIINSTIIANSAASDGEGIYIHTSTATIQNSIVWNEISIYNGGTYTIENSVVQGSSDVSDGNIDATSLTVNDLFTDQANGDYSLKHTSPAVNTGNNALYTGTLGTDKDLAGSPRLYDGAPATDIIDMGAYEYRDIIDPVFTSATTANFAENGTSTAYTVAATDANTVSYSLGTGNDEALFNIVGATGVVTFKNSPDFENPADGDANNTYAINVIASDGINSVNQDVTITVTNVDDTDPVFTSLTTANFAENGTGTAYTVAATDANTITYSLGAGNDEALFDIVASTGVVTFKTSPDYENPTDGDTDNDYAINVIASDGINSVNQDVTITVTNVDDTDPVFTSATTANFAENGTGTAYTVAATDANTITYSLGAGNDEALFDIVASTGVVTFKTSPDYENPDDGDTDNDYVINVIASDGVNSVNQDVTITVTNVDDTDPVFTSATTANFAENGTGAAYTVAATDANTVSYSLGAGNDEALFDIVASTGVVTFKTSPDYENPTDGDTDNDYAINVIASDGVNSVNQDVTITVTNVDDTDPVFTSATTANFAENGTGTAYTVAATDANTVSYSLGTGNDEALFDIVGTTGVVTFKASPDYESPTDGDANNTYVINVVASDGVNSVNQDVTITVTNVDDTDPVFTSATTANFAENGTGTAYTVAATDANTITYSIGAGNDEALFDIVGTTGVVTFKASPDYESPTDGDANNTYVINIVASDGVNSVNQDVTITVTNVDDTDPVFTSATTANFAENGTGTAYTVAATDANTITYSIGAGNDEALFDIVGTTGVVTFKNAPDYENPADGDTDNDYVINVVASDGVNSVNQDVTITVTDMDEIQPSVTITSDVSSLNSGAFDITVTFGEIVTGFAVSDLTVTNGVASNFSGSGTTYTATITPSADGEVTIDIAAGVAQDMANNTNTIAAQLSITNDETRPGITINSPSVNVSSGAFNTTFTFSELVIGFAIEDIMVTNGTASNFAGSGSDYTATITPSADGVVTVDVRADVAQDAATNTNTAATQLSITNDETKPSVTIASSSTSPTSGAFNVTITFSESVTGFVIGDLTVDNGIASNFTGSGTTYTAAITPSADGAVTLNVAAGVAQDAASNTNTAATQFSIINDQTKPSVSLTAGSSNPVAGLYSITAQFSEGVIGFSLDDIIVVGGTASSFVVVDADTYTFSVTSTNSSATVNIEEGVAIDVVGNYNTASNSLSLVFNLAPTNLMLSNTSVSENNSIGQLIGNLSTTDADATDTHTYSLVSGTGGAANASFTIVGNKLQAAEIFDFELKTSYSIRIKTDDGRGGTYEKQFTISITNIEEPEVRIESDYEIPATALGLTSNFDITIHNDGDALLMVNSVLYPNGFVGLVTGLFINPGESKVVTLGFMPTEAKVYTGTISFITNAGTVSMTVSGEGAIITGVDDGFIDAEEINLFPNPAQDILNIDLSELGNRTLDISIINASGTSVFTKAKVTEKSLRLNVSDYTNGLYIVQFTDGISVVRKKVMIKR